MTIIKDLKHLLLTACLPDASIATAKGGLIIIHQVLREVQGK
jgi:hypothetical protein